MSYHPDQCLTMIPFHTSIADTGNISSESQHRQLEFWHEVIHFLCVCAEKVITPGSPLVGSNPQPTTLCLPRQTSDMLWLSLCLSRTPQRPAAIYSSSTIIFLQPPFCTTGLLLTFKGSIKKSASSLSVFFCARDLWSSVSGRPRSISNFLCSTPLHDLWGRSSEWLLPPV